MERIVLWRQWFESWNGMKNWIIDERQWFESWNGMKNWIIDENITLIDKS